MRRTAAAPARAHRRGTSRRGLLAPPGRGPERPQPRPRRAAGPGGRRGPARARRPPSRAFPSAGPHDMSSPSRFPQPRARRCGRCPRAATPASRSTARPGSGSPPRRRRRSSPGAQADLVLGRDHFAVRQGVAVLRAGTTEVLDCSVTSGESSTGPVVLAGGSAVLVVQFVAENGSASRPASTKGCGGCAWGPGAATSPTTAGRTPPSSPHFPTARPSTPRWPAAQAQDGVTTLADCEGTLSYPTASARHGGRSRRRRAGR